MKPIKVGYADENIIFKLRMISVAEEETYTQRFSNISESDENKHQKRFEIYRDALTEFSTEMPVIEKDGKESPMGKDSTADAMQKYFATRTPEKERILQYAYILFRNQLEPNAVFL